MTDFLPIYRYLACILVFFPPHAHGVRYSPANTMRLCALRLGYDTGDRFAAGQHLVIASTFRVKVSAVSSAMPATRFSAVLPHFSLSSIPFLRCNCTDRCFSFRRIGIPNVRFTAIPHLRNLTSLVEKQAGSAFFRYKKWSEKSRLRRPR